MATEIMVVGMILILLGWLAQLYYSAGKRIFVLSLEFVVIHVVWDLSF